MKKLFYLISLCLLFTSANAQSIYRSATGGGNWNVHATWERFNGLTWVTPTPGQGYPGEFPGTLSVLIKDNVTVTATVPNPIGALNVGDGTAGNLTFSSAGSAAYNISVANDLTFNAGQLLVTNNTGQNEHRIIVGGNVGSNNQFSINAFATDDFVTISLAGTSNQSIAVSSAMNFTSLEIFKSSGDVLLSNNIFIMVSAAFIDGIVYSTSSNKVHFQPGSVVLYADDNSFVDGPVRREGVTDFGFPVGEAGAGFHPIFVGGTSLPSTYEAMFFDASAYTLGPVDPSSNLAVVSNCEYWSLVQITGQDADVGVSWTPASACNGTYIQDLDDLRVAWFNGSEWEEAAGTGYDNTYPSTPPSASTTTFGALRRIGATQESFFALASVDYASSPLPVKFLSLNAVAQSQGNLVKWETSNESNLNGYELQRSPDGKNFVTINQQPAANRIQKNSYSYLDAGANSPTSYYRVRSIDVDGELNYSPIVKLGGTKPGSTFTVFPNPVRGRSIIIQTQSLSGGNYELRLVNSLGQGVHSQLISHVGGALNLGVHLPASLSRGIYHLQLVSPENRLSKMILIE